MRNLDESVVVIVGASSGVGRSAALQFARKGATLMLAARREDALEEVAEHCRAYEAQVVVFPLDITDEEAVKNLAHEGMRRFGRIDVWVNAATVNAYGRVEELPSDWWRRVVEINLHGYANGMRAVLPWFREQGGGTIINVGSVLDSVVVPYQSAYVAAKHAVRSLSDSVREECRDIPGIKISTISPGPIDTPFFSSAANVTGLEVEPPLRVHRADHVAKVVVKNARRPKRHKVVGPDNRLSLRLVTRLPGLARGPLAIVGDHDQFGDRRVAPTPGALFEPHAGTSARVAGGWLDPGSKHAIRKRQDIAASVVMGALVAATVAAIAVKRSRSSRLPWR